MSRGVGFGVGRNKQSQRILADPLMRAKIAALYQGGLLLVTLRKRYRVSSETINRALDLENVPRRHSSVQDKAEK